MITQKPASAGFLLLERTKNIATPSKHNKKAPQGAFVSVLELVASMEIRHWILVLFLQKLYTLSLLFDIRLIIIGKVLQSDIESLLTTYCLVNIGNFALTCEPDKKIRN